MSVEVPGPQVPSTLDFGQLPPCETPAVDFSGVSVPWHLTPELLSYFPRAPSSTSFALDLGCGSGLHKTVCEEAGFKWVGVDYNSRLAPILADAHALPFASESMDFVLSIAVLEHLRYPLIAMGEVYRVLKPGGCFIGTVAFLEPFHGNSYYHHTHLGSFTSLSAVGFSIDRIAANARWSGLRAQASMGGLFPRMPQTLARSLVLPLELLSRFWWFVGRFVSRRVTPSQRLLTNTGSFEFVAHKPA